MMARLGDVCSFFSGTGFPNQYQGKEYGEYPFFKVGDISKNIQLGYRTLKQCDNYVNDDIVKAIRGTIVPKGTVVFAKIGEALRLNRRAITPCECLIDNNVIGIKPVGGILSTTYFYHFMTALDLQKYCEATTVPSVRKTTLEKIEIDVPSIDVQEKISMTLDKVSALISLRRQQLAKLDELVKARFVEMFGEPTCNPKQWTKFALDKRCEIITGNTPSRADAENYGSFIEWIKSDNINTPYTYLTTAQEYLSEKGFKKCRCVDSGSILMTCIAGSIGCIGNIAITDRTVAFNQQINAVVPHIDEVFYLYWMLFLSKPFMQSTINKALKGILSKSQLSNMEFPFPPRYLQAQFAAFCGQIEGQKLTIRQSLDKLELLKKSLMQEYFG